MMNPLQIMQMLRGGNPQEAIINEMKKSAGNNPVMQNALDMAEKHDSKGLENDEFRYECSRCSCAYR